eukprot:2716604-Pyramimonas_sp.AAC.1
MVPSATAEASMSARYPNRVLLAWREGLRPRCSPSLEAYARHLPARTAFCERWKTTRAAAALLPPQGTLA